MKAAEKLAKLRQHLDGVDGLFVPMSDPFLSEYVPAHENRIAWLTGFSGSSATVVVLKNRCAFFTDGRYTLQAKDEVDSSQFEIYNSGETSPAKWLSEHAKGLTFGVDAARISVAELERLQKSASVKLLDESPVDKCWETPSFKTSKAWDYPIEFAGESSFEKRARIVKNLKADVAFIGSSESVNWLLNIRGHDVESTPVLHCFALLFINTEVQLFTHDNFNELPAALAALKGRKVLIDKATTTANIVHMLQGAGAEIIYGDDPCALLRALKNPVEIAAIITAHIKDGAALSSALSKVENAGDELGVDALLLAERSKQEGFLFPSFPTIAGMNAHGAIVHYRATEANNAKLTQGLLLIDSGGQYMGGTTDVTRTVAICTPTAEHKAWFTRVLKGHIALATTTFPKGTTGSQLDALARQFLWAAGGDYDHGTGHGVGNCLGVHEGPQRISKRASDVALQVGMILSNEPGYYKAGEFGIRIENLVHVVEKANGFLGFETLTCAPIDRSLIDASLMTEAEKTWLNNYHARVFATLSPLLAEPAQSWLNQACAAI